MQCNLMAALSLSIDAIRPLNRWDFDSIRPGPVGSVGDCLVTPRLKSSLPGDFRWQKEYYGKNESLYGSAISDGMYLSFNSGGGPSKTIDSNWGGRRRFRTSHGWYYQDMRAPDKTVEPVMGALPQYSWRNKIATNIRARTTGNLFPIPAGGILEPPNGITRGGQYPRVTDVVSGDTTPGGPGGVGQGPTGTNPQLNPSSSFSGGPATPIGMDSTRRALGRNGTTARNRRS